jgi:hypothetical protein
MKDHVLNTTIHTTKIRSVEVSEQKSLKFFAFTKMCWLAVGKEQEAQAT